MTLEERFVQLLEQKACFIEVGDEVKLIAADELRDNLLDSGNSPSNRPDIFWDLLSQLISPEGPYLALLEGENFEKVARIVSLGRKIDPIKWESEYEAEHGLHFHFFSAESSIQKSKGMDGENTDFYHYNSANGLAESVAFVDLRVDPTNADGSMFNYQDDDVQVIASLLLLENLEGLSEGSAIITSIENCEEAKALLEYHLVLHGNSWSEPVLLPTATLAHIKGLRAFVGAPEHFLQFKEPFSMLSNVNASTGILEVFMSTYHALENYMIRSQVASTFTENSNLSLNRVRDFKRLGARIDQSESKFLKDLFAGCWDRQVGNQTLIEMALECRQTYLTEHPAASDDLDSFFKLLDIKKARDKPKLEYAAFTNGNEDSFRGWFSLLVYAIRCSVVHNKATEFHISNENLAANPNWQALIAELCMPIMLQLAFGLPSVAGSDNPIRYSSKEISLYQ